MIDPVTLEVIRNTLPAIANEMAADLQRSSYNMMIYEVCDFCTALTDARGSLISQNVGGVSHFVADLGVIIEDVVAREQHATLLKQEAQMVGRVPRRRDTAQRHAGKHHALAVRGLGVRPESSVLATGFRRHPADHQGARAFA